MADSHPVYEDAVCLSGLRKFSLRATKMRITMCFWLICIVMEPVKFYGIHQSFPAEKSNKKRDLKTACSFSIMKTAKKNSKFQVIFGSYLFFFSSSCHKNTFSVSFPSPQAFRKWIFLLACIFFDHAITPSGSPFMRYVPYQPQYV